MLYAVCFSFLNKLFYCLFFAKLIPAKVQLFSIQNTGKDFFQDICRGWAVFAAALYYCTIKTTEKNGCFLHA
jgi:hypothetical protein